MKSIIMNKLLVALLFTSLTFCGCSGSVLAKRDHLFKNLSMAQPKEGKALVNFHRPSPYGHGAGYRIFDSAGRQITILYGYQGFQYQCEPGEQVFYGWSKWASKVSVVKADLAPNRVYDILVDYGVNGNFSFIPLTKNDSRRSRLPIIEAEEEHTDSLTNERVAEIADFNARKGWGFLGVSQSGPLCLQDPKRPVLSPPQALRSYYQPEQLERFCVEGFVVADKITELTRSEPAKDGEWRSSTTVIYAYPPNPNAYVSDGDKFITYSPGFIPNGRVSREILIIYGTPVAKELNSLEGRCRFMTNPRETGEFKARVSERQRQFQSGAIANEVKTVGKDDCR